MLRICNKHLVICKLFSDRRKQELQLENWNQRSNSRLIWHFSDSLALVSLQSLIFSKPTLIYSRYSFAGETIKLEDKNNSALVVSA